jgi:hypothetical protein
MSAQEEQSNDEQERAAQQKRGEHGDPNRPSHREEDDGDREPSQHPGGNPGDPGAAPAPDSQEDAAADTHLGQRPISHPAPTAGRVEDAQSHEAASRAKKALEGDAADAGAQGRE